MASRPRNFSPWAYWMLGLATVERVDLCPTQAGRPDLDAWRHRSTKPTAAADALEHDVFDGGHRWNGARAEPFLDRWLGE